jgi:chromate reductase
MEEPTFRILGIAGSLRRASYNRGLLRAAQEVAPAGVRLEIFALDALPLYNDDVLAVGAPEPVEAFKAALAGADALLIATPEYNYSIPGVLKNALDWASRPPPTSPLRFKPVGLMGASTGGFGTVRAQLALRQVFIFTESYVMVKPELLVSQARDKFDADGNLTDAATRAKLAPLITALVAWARQVGHP